MRRGTASTPGTTTTHGVVESADGTIIAFERSGAGPALILIDSAGHHRNFGPMRSVAEQLAAAFTVYTYDRRGRGHSTDTLPYAVQREVEDLAALIAEAGGCAYAYAVSSGALLALHAAASGLKIPKLALFEPPISSEEDRPDEQEFTAELSRLVAAGRRDDAVEFFHSGIGVPAELIHEMRTTSSWESFEAIAHTLVYDCIISTEMSLELVASATTPTLVIDSAASTDDLTGSAAAVVDALPNGRHRSLAGEWHGVPDEALAPVLTEFFQA